MAIPAVFAGAAAAGVVTGIGMFTARHTVSGLDWTARQIGSGLDEVGDTVGGVFDDVGTAIGDAFRWVDRQFTSTPKVLEGTPTPSAETPAAASAQATPQPSAAPAPDLNTLSSDILEHTLRDLMDQTNTIAKILAARHHIDMPASPPPTEAPAPEPPAQQAAE